MSWYNTSWLYRVKVTILAAKVDADLTDYPIYVDLFDLPADFHTNVNQTDARDIRVTNSDGTTEVPREVVFYTAASNTGELHFKGDVDSVTDTNFYIYCGNADATEPAVDATFGRNNVWTSNYKSVLHLNESSGSPVESAGLVSASYVGNLPNAQSGQIGSGQDLDGDGDYIELANDSDLDCTNQTVSFWLRADVLAGPTANAFYTRRTATSNGQMIFYFVTPNTINWDTIGNTKRWDTGYLPPTNGSKVLLHFTFDGSVKRLYVNGSLQSNTVSDTHSLSNVSSVARIGVDTFLLQYYINGLVDEFRIAGINRSATWISTEYNNQFSPSTFYSIGEADYRRTLTDSLTPSDGIMKQAGKFLEEK